MTDLVVSLSDKTKATDRSARWSSRVISHQRRIVAGLVKRLHRIVHACVCVDKYVGARACMRVWDPSASVRIPDPLNFRRA